MSNDLEGNLKVILYISPNTFKALYNGVISESGSGNSASLFLERIEPRLSHVTVKICLSMALSLSFPEFSKLPLSH
jgi:hypothetical protein